MSTSASVQFIRCLPHPQLRGLVETLWYAHGHGGLGPERVLPNGRGMLIVNVGDAYEVDSGETAHAPGVAPDAWLCGVQTRSVLSRPRGATRVYGIVLRPHGIAPLFRMSGLESADRLLDLSDVVGRAAADLREQLGEADKAETGIAIVEKFLLQRLPKKDAHWLVRTAPVSMESGQVKRIDQLAHELGVSRKHVAELFRSEIGLQPRVYSQIARFNRALAALATDTSLAAIAADCGYVDQAHFQREFRQFSGMTPGTYRTQQRRHFGNAAGNDQTRHMVPIDEVTRIQDA